MKMTPRALRAAFGRYLTGVTVVTARDAAGAPVGFTANSFTSVSLDPPMLLVCPGRHLSSFAAFAGAERFGVSILAEGQEPIATLFAAGKGDRFAGDHWSVAGPGATPLIEGAAARFVCRTVERVDAGDHLVLIGAVERMEDAAAPGLGYGPEGFFSPVRDRLANTAARAGTHAAILLERAGHLYLTHDGALPGCAVAPGESPLATLTRWLDTQRIAARPGPVYALWDDADGARRVVFRATPDMAPATLSPHAIASLDGIATGCPAVEALLRRFRAEHAAGAFGFYLGTADAGDVIPAMGGS